MTDWFLTDFKNLFTQTSTFLNAMAAGRIQLNFLSAVDWEILAELLNFFSKKILVDLFRYDPVVFKNDFINRRRSMRHLGNLLNNSYKIWTLSWLGKLRSNEIKSKHLS